MSAAVQRPPIPYLFRVSHAEELLGDHYGTSTARFGERYFSLHAYIQEIVRSRIERRHRREVPRITRAILLEARRYRMDPLLIVAVIRTESDFRVGVEGPAGEIGLMQLKPATAAWLADEVGMPWVGSKRLKDPVYNIRLGTLYLARLRERFERRSPLYLVAYNSGVSGVHRALKNGDLSGEYSDRVLRNYLEFYKPLSRTSPPKRRPI